MIIIRDNSSGNLIKIPSNLEKSSYVLHLKNIETKEELDITISDTGESDNYFITSDTLGLQPGEYSYVISGNVGLLRVEDKMGKKEYDDGISFKTYDPTYE